MTFRRELQFPHQKTCAVILASGAVRMLPEIWDARWRDAVIIGDAFVLSMYGLALADLLAPSTRRVIRLGIPPGEEHKTRQTKRDLEDRMLAEGLGRQTCVVALGGGISLDLAGFVAATYMRGVPHVNVPTSLLAQLDASIGGKTGVNTRRGKNLVGAIHQPEAVIIDPDYLKSLPPDEWTNGMAEAVKHAVIADADLFRRLEDRTAELTGDPPAIDEDLLRRCVEIKADIVEQDERERGPRSQLNLGHTVGHALERASDHALPHGQAVAAGMLVEATLARTLCGFPVDDHDRLRRVLAALSLSPERPRPRFEVIRSFLMRDKKNRDDKVMMALPARIGEMARDGDGYTVAAPLSLVQRAYELES